MLKQLTKTVYALNVTNNMISNSKLYIPGYNLGLTHALGSGLPYDVYKIICIDTQATEKHAKRIVEDDIFDISYPDYVKGCDDQGYRNNWFGTALESLESLKISKGCSTGVWLFLEKI